MTTPADPQNVRHFNFFERILNKRVLIPVVAPLTIVVLALVGWGLYTKQDNITHMGAYLAQIGVWAIGIGLLTAILCVLISRLTEALDHEGPPRFQREWGALGEGVQGWEISRSMTYVLLVLFTGGLLTMLVTNFPEYAFDQQTENSSKATGNGQSLSEDKQADKQGAPSEKQSPGEREQKSGNDEAKGAETKDANAPQMNSGKGAPETSPTTLGTK